MEPRPEPDDLALRHRTPRGLSPAIASGLASKLIERVEAVILGQRPLVERLVVALLAGGHVLVEGVPGLAKTLAARELARALDLPFRRIQFTPDLLPADLTGSQVYYPALGTFEARPGPIVTSVLLADEINRAPAKVQSALLEAMQEGQVTIGDSTLRLPEPFWVIATQNSVEHEGTYPLPEAQLDRFLMKLVVGYPSRAAELEILDLHGSTTRVDPPPGPSIGPEEVLRLQSTLDSVRAVPELKAYIVDLVRATREPAGLGLERFIELGASPRAAIGLLRSSRALAVVSGRDYVTPSDVKALAKDVLRHRIALSYEAEAEGRTADGLLDQVLDTVPVP